MNKAPVLAIAAVVLLLFSGCTTLAWSTRESAVGAPEYVKLGTVEIRQEVWNPLFRLSKKSRVENLVAAATASATATYGADALLGTVDIHGSWKPISLIFGLGALGMVEDAVATATVFAPAPPPPPKPVQPPPKPDPPPQPAPPRTITVVTFLIEPVAEIRDEYGYMRIEYFTKEAAEERIRTRLAKRGVSEEKIAKEVEKIAPGGFIRVNIGRQDLLHANTRWYSYVIFHEGVPVFQYTGVEGIPNVKGRDGNWWNIVDLPVEQPIADQVELSIHDGKSGSEYHYVIVRHEETVLVDD